MTRPRVPDNKRQRTARACDSCKRRKQKCNGLNPCNTCLKRSLVCEYTDGRSPPKGIGSSSSVTATMSAATARKRRHAAEAQFSAPGTASTTPSTSDMARQGGTPLDTTALSSEEREAGSSGGGKGLFQFATHHHTPATSDAGGGSPNRQSSASEMTDEDEDDEEIEIVRQSRMLEDTSNRLYYLGDSSSYSFLQLIRMIVDNAAGPSAFTADPHRHKMLDTMDQTVQPPMMPYILPGRDVASLIARSYFVNTHGILELFDRHTFDDYLDACYTNPLSVGSSTLCSVYLVLAIGLAMAAPVPGSYEDGVFRRLQGERPAGRAEALFRAAKALLDPMGGSDEADPWVIQGWALMTVYLMMNAKTTAAYSYCGMAIRSACALGLHRMRDTMSLFSNIRQHLRLRCRIWRSLFVLDRFLAASLGRPCAICDDDCPDEEELDAAAVQAGDDDTEQEAFSSRSLESSVKSARTLGRIIRGLYASSRDTVSTKQAQGIVDECDLWSIRVCGALSSENISQGKVGADRGVAILHVYLLHYHAIVLLTRPFFVHLVVRAQAASPKPAAGGRFSRMDKFAQACVAASTWSISLIQAVFDSKYLPRRNPFILYFLFSSAVVIMSNEFSGLFQNTHYASCMASIFAILEYCKETDVQAPRMLYILQTFHAAVEEHARHQNHHQQRQEQQHAIHDPLQILDSRRRSTLASGCRLFRGEDEVQRSTEFDMDDLGDEDNFHYEILNPMV